MSLTLKPYPTYRSARKANVTPGTTIPWLSSVPAHWSVVPSKRLFIPRKEKARIDDEQLSATQAFGVIKQQEFEQRVSRKVTRITQHLEDRAHVEKDDFVISMRSFQGGLERAWEKGCIRSSYVVLKPSPLVDVEYFSYLLKSHEYIRALQTTSNFIRDGQDLSFANFALVDLPLIPLPEQRSIGGFLHWADNNVHTAIRAKRRVIELLNEQKQVFIDSAVTRGISAHKFTRTEIEWLREIPDGWSSVRFGSIAKSIQTGPFGSQLHSSDYVYGGTPIINPSHLKNGRIIPDGSCTVSSSKRDELARHKLHTGDIIFARRGELGRCALVEESNDGWLCGTGSLRVELRTDLVDPRYLVKLMLSSAIRGWLSSRSIGSTMENLNPALLSRLPLPLPPLGEQEKILSAIRDEVSHLNASHESLENEISLLREYRTRLIADLVTGRIDVRGLELPEMPAVAEQLTDVAAGQVADEQELVGVQEGDDAAD